MTDEKCKLRDSGRRSGALAALSIVVIIVLVFHRTIFSGESISRADLLACWDSAFSNMKFGSTIGIDKSSMLFLLPYNFLVSELWSSGQIPLWNALSGLGCPLLADPESSVFSPFNIPMILSPSMYTHNLLLVAKIMIMALGTLFLTRRLGLNIYACLFAALSIAFCPYNQWYLELIGNGYCLTPFLFLAFTYAAEFPEEGKKDFLYKSLIAGIMAGITILSGHCEISFCAIMAASLWAIFYALSVNPVSSAKMIAERLVSILFRISLAGVVCFLLSAPMLLTFLEFLFNSDSYKFGEHEAFVPVQSLFLSFVQPGFGGASPYIGMIAFLFLPFSIFRKDGSGRNLALSTVILFLIFVSLACRIPPVSYISNVCPFNFIMPHYYLHVVILLAVLLSSMGFDFFIRLEESLRKPFLFSIAGLCLVPVALRPITKLFKLPENLIFDSVLPPIDFSKFDWYLSIASAILVALLILAMVLAKSWYSRLCTNGFLLISLVTLLCIAEPALEARPRFDYPKIPILEETARSKERIIAIGTHLFMPNLNQIYGIRDLRSFNALFPSRYLAFVEKAGAEVTPFDVYFNPPLSKILDLASVKYILTKKPIYDKAMLDSVELSKIAVPNALKINLNAQINDIQVKYIPSWRAVFGKLTTANTRAKNFYFRVLLFNEQSLLVSMTNKLNFTNSLVKDFCISVPAAEEGEKFYLGLEIFNGTEKVEFLPDPELNIRSKAIIVYEFNYEKDRSNDKNKSLALIKESKSHQIRLYENRNALPDAYVARNIILTGSKEESLSSLDKVLLNPGSTVVLESPDDGVSFAVSSLKKLDVENSKGIDSIKVARPQHSKVVIDADLFSPGILTITDIWYPGWKAYIDENETPIMHGNFLFKSVAVPAGKHKVRFEYSPLSFKIGVGCFLLFLSILFGILVRKLSAYYLNP